MKKIALIGANYVANIALDFGQLQYPQSDFCFVDDDPQKKNKTQFGISVIGNTADLIEGKLACDAFINCIGGKHMHLRKDLSNKIQESGISPINIIHPSFIKGKGATLGYGNLLSAHIYLGQNSILGNNIFMAAGCIADHDNKIGDGCYFGASVTLSGCVEVGECTFFGSGSTVLPSITIGNYCVIGAGAVVTKNIPDNTIVAGVPAKPLIK
jgi:sugar O-acyltransferase (sialic acid O-acetyltransferase NeuD family)